MVLLLLLHLYPTLHAKRTRKTAYIVHPISFILTTPWGRLDWKNDWSDCVWSTVTLTTTDNTMPDKLLACTSFLSPNSKPGIRPNLGRELGIPESQKQIILNSLVVAGIGNSCLCQSLIEIALSCLPQLHWFYTVVHCSKTWEAQRETSTYKHTLNNYQRVVLCRSFHHMSWMLGETSCFSCFM